MNVIYTVVGEPFEKWVKNKIQERNERVTSNANMLIELDPEVAKIFKASTAVSGKYLSNSFIFWSFYSSNLYLNYSCKG